MYPERILRSEKLPTSKTVPMLWQIWLFSASRKCTKRNVLCALHNGGGVGIGKSINGGFGLLLDGSERVDEILKSAMMWDVMGGVARRNWARNEHAVETSVAYNENYAGKGHITIPYIADEDLVEKTVDKFVK